MPKTKEQKQEILQQLTENLAKQQAMVFVDFKGLGVKDISAFRKELKENDAQLLVGKKTLLQKALAEKGIEVDLKQMEGQIAVVFAYGNPLVAIKNTYTFAKANENLKIVGGYFENQIQETSLMIELASLPSKEELLARLTGTIAAPLSGLVTVLQGNTKGLLIALSAIQGNKA